jgi:hypothetical protein
MHRDARLRAVPDARSTTAAVDHAGAVRGLVRARDGVRYADQDQAARLPGAETPFLKRGRGARHPRPLGVQWKKHVLDAAPDTPFRDGTFNTYKGLRPAYYYVGFKNSHPLFRDKEVRRALSLACDVQQIADKIFLGRLVPMASPIFPNSPSADRAEAARVRPQERAASSTSVGGSSTRRPGSARTPSTARSWR